MSQEAQAAVDKREAEVQAAIEKKTAAAATRVQESRAKAAAKKAAKFLGRAQSDPAIPKDLSSAFAHNSDSRGLASDE